MGKTIITKVVAVVGMAAISMSASANPTPPYSTTLTLEVGASGTDVVGEVLPGYIGAGANDGAGQAADESSDANAVISLGLGMSGTVQTGKDSTDTSWAYRSLNNFGTLNSAGVTGNAVLASGGGMATSGNWVQINIGDTGYTYLVGRWDGPNAGAEVWDISGITDTTIYIPISADPEVDPSTGRTNLVDTAGGQYGITSYSLFNATPPPPTVPEAASTFALLGGAFAGLGLIRKKLSAK